MKKANVSSEIERNERSANETDRVGTKWGLWDTERETDILALEEESKILGRC